MSAPPARLCLHCHNEMPSREDNGRGRPAEYCGPPCRQAAYRERHKKRSVRPTANPRPEDVDRADPDQIHSQLLELAKDLQEELRHISRLLGPGPQPSSLECLELSVRIQRRAEVLTSGLVLLARRRRIAWNVLGSVLLVGPETARRSYRVEAIERSLNLESPPRPAVDPAGSGARDDTPAAVPSVPAPRRASNQLAPILSCLHRKSRLPLRQLAVRTGVSASYLSRVLAGENLPTWDLTERIALVLGADTQALRKVWEDERSRTASRRRRSAAPDSGREEQSSLTTALRSLHRRAGRPAPDTLAAGTGHTLDARTIQDTLRGTHVPDWNDAHLLILALDGEPSFFRPLWEHAQQHFQTAGPTQPDTPDARVGNLMRAFGDVLATSSTPSTPVAARRNRALRHRLALSRPAL